MNVFDYLLNFIIEIFPNFIFFPEPSYRHQSLKNILPLPSSSTEEPTSFFTPSMLFYADSNPAPEAVLSDIHQIEVGKVGGSVSWSMNKSALC